MKELSIEQKAQRYDESIERAKRVLLDCTSEERKVVEYITPELKESEGEEIRKEIIAILKYKYEKFPKAPRYSNVPKWIDWLEKQGEHANFRNKIQIGDKVTRNEDGVLVNLSQLNRVAKKQGEQKPAAWSEEDEKQVRQIERIVHDDGCTQKLQKQIADWFKSLKERYTWKPSDEQLKSLKEVIDVGHFTSYPNALETLYEQLKKLREE